MQPASDLFLGWATGQKGYHLHVRQLRDVIPRARVETHDAKILSIYAEVFGWALARSY
jgi:hypothetical protein